MNTVPYSRQWIDESDIEAVISVLKSDWLTQGPKVKEFEDALASYSGAKYSVVVSSGTAALHLACLAAEIGPGDEVITSPITFVASANCALYVGAKPVFVDIAPDTICLDPLKIRDFLKQKRLTPHTSRPTQPKAVIPVHFAGLPCDMEAIKTIADEHELVVIEDACHALGAEWKNSKGKWHKIGSCSHSDMAVFSFHPVKHITTGEGGAITTNNPELYERLLLLRTHGITKTPTKFINKDLAYSSPQNPIAGVALRTSEANPWYYEMQELGFNYRITDIQCALGRSQLKKLDSFVEKRRSIAAIYNEAFKDVEWLKTPIEPETRKSAYHLYVVQINFKKLGKSRSQVMNELKRNGVGTQVHYIPVYLQPYYSERLRYGTGDCPLAEDYYRKALSLPLYPDIRDEDVKKAVISINELLLC